MADASKPAPKHKDEAGDAEERQRRHERITLVLFLEGAVAIVAGMFLLSEFLSKGKADRTTLYVAGGLFGLLILGVGVTWFLRRRGDNA